VSLRTVIGTPWRDFVAVTRPDAAGESVVTAAWFADDGPPDEVSARAAASAPIHQVPEVVRSVTAWLDGEVDALSDVPVAPVGAPFHLRVWAALRAVPAGSVATYGEIAGRVGAARAARAVGTACASNTIALFVPCHRVVSVNGVGGYGWRPDLKVALLEHEGVDVERLSSRSYLRRGRR